MLNQQIYKQDALELNYENKDVSNCIISCCQFSSDFLTSSLSCALKLNLMKHLSLTIHFPCLTSTDMLFKYFLLVKPLHWVTGPVQLCSGQRYWFRVTDLRDTAPNVLPWYWMVINMLQYLQTLEQGELKLWLSVRQFNRLEQNLIEGTCALLGLKKNILF